MKIFDERSEHGDALDNDSPSNFGRVPDLGHGIAPDIPAVVAVHKWGVFPPSSDGGDDGNTGQLSAHPKREQGRTRARDSIWTYSIPRLKVTQSPIFSAFFKLSGQVMNHGKMAKMKSMMML